MIKLTFCLHRLPGLSLEEFQDYWFNQHAPLVKSQKDALKIARYVQLHSAPDLLGTDAADVRGAPTGYDGVAQLWWNSIEDLAAGGATEEGREAGRLLLEDEKKFIDLARSPLFWGIEKEIF